MFSNRMISRSFGRFEMDKIDTDDTDSQFSLYSNESSPSVTQESQQNSPNQDSQQNSSDGFSKLLPTKKTGNSVAANHITKQLVQETLIDEGLRVVKELANQIKDDGSGVDLRVFNKLSESDRPNRGITSSPPIDTMRSMYKSDTPRPRGRPPKMIDYGGMAQMYLNQGLNQSHSNSSHISHHLLSNFSHIQQNLSQTSLPFNPNGFNNCSNSSVIDDEPNESNDTSNGHSFGQMDAQKGLPISATDLSKYSNDSLINGTKDCNLSGSPKSLSSLMAINGNGMNAENFKSEHLNCSSV